MSKVLSCAGRARDGLCVALLAAAVAALLTAAGASASSTPAKKVASVVVTTRSLAKLGTVLVDSKGYTLYMFVPDKDKKVTCVKGCAAVWPPVMVPSGAKIVGSGSVKSSLLGSDPDPAGGRVVTYAGWPLYRWVGDSAPGKDTGQAVNVNGGLWYVLSASGRVITTKLVAPKPATKPTTTPAATTPAPSQTTPASTTPSASPPAAAPPANGPPYNETDASCTNGTTIVTSGNSDGDGDEMGAEPSDGDGCI